MFHPFSNVCVCECEREGGTHTFALTFVCAHFSSPEGGVATCQGKFETQEVGPHCLSKSWLERRAAVEVGSAWSELRESFVWEQLKKNEKWRAGPVLGR